MKLMPAPSAINRRRLANFRANGRGYWSLWIITVLFVLSLFAELIANDRPALVEYKGRFYTPIFKSYPETTFGGANTIKAFETADQALADLNAGNVDVILADSSYISEIIAGSSGALEVVGPDVMLGNGVGAGLRKADTELRDKLTGVIDEMKKDGSLDALIIKWFPDKAPGPIFAGG